MTGFSSGQRKTPKQPPHFIKTYSPYWVHPARVLLASPSHQRQSPKAAPVPPPFLVPRDPPESKARRPQSAKTGSAAAWEEYRQHKQAGTLNIWRERWGFLLGLQLH